MKTTPRNRNTMLKPNKEQKKKHTTKKKQKKKMVLAD